MLRSLGVITALKWFLLAAVAVAVWQSFDGNLGAIASTLWAWVLTGADVVRTLWSQVN